MKPKYRNLLLSLGTALITVSFANAGTLYWDGGTGNIGTDGNGLSNGTAGNWDTTLLNWDAGAAPHVAWDNTNTLLNPADTAVFGTSTVTGGTVTLTAPITVSGLRFYNTGYTIAASTQGLTFGATDNTINLFGTSGTTASATISGTVNSVAGGNLIFNSVNPVVASTMTFSGASATGWTGSTTINSGMTVQSNSSGGVNQVFNNTSAININGGILRFDRSGITNTNIINDSAAITVNGGGTLFQQNLDAGNPNAIETVGAVTVNSGQFNFNINNGGSSGSIVRLGNLTVNGTSTVTFSFNAATNNFWENLNGGSPPANTAADEIIGAWATTGAAGGVAAQTDYAIYTNSNGRIAARNIAASAQSTWSTTHAATRNYTLNNNGVAAAVNGRLTVDRNINTLRNTTNTTAPSAVDPTTEYITMAGNDLQDGDVVVSRNTTGGQLTQGRPYYVINAGGAGAGTFQVSTTPGGAAVNLTTTAVGFVGAGVNLNGNTLGTYGILAGSSDPLAIGGGAGSKVTLAVADVSGNLYVTNGNASVWIDAPITDNGTGKLTLVKSGTSPNGSGNVTLSGNNTYTGGTVINSGTLSIGSASNIGGSGANLTFGGTGQLTATGALSGLGTLTVDQGAVGTIVTSTTTTFASTSGAGTLVANPGSSSGIVDLGDASGFTGNLHARMTGNLNVAATSTTQIRFTDIADTVGSSLQFSGGTSDSGQIVRMGLYGNGGQLTFNNRQIQLLPRTGSNWNPTQSALINDNTNVDHTWVINTDLLMASTSSTLGSGGVRSLALGGSNTGDNAFNGRLMDGDNGSHLLGVVKQGAGKWILGGANTYTGATTVTAGNLEIGGSGTLGNVSAGVGEYAGAISIANTNSGRLTYNSSATQTLSGVVSGAGALFVEDGTLVLTNGNSYTGATTVSEGKLTIASTGNINTTSGVTIGTASTAATSEFNYNSSTALTKAVSFAAGSTGGTLSGSSTINLAVNVTAGNTLAIGNSVGVMNFGSDLTVGGTYLFELNNTDNTADLGDVTGNLTLGGILDLVQLGAFEVGDKFTLFAYDGTLSGTFSGIADDTNFTDAGGIWTMNYNDTVAGLNGGTSVNNTFVTITSVAAIPEPNVAALLGALGTLALLRRRR